MAEVVADLVNQLVGVRVHMKVSISNIDFKKRIYFYLDLEFQYNVPNYSSARQIK